MILATGFYDVPNPIGCPGEELPKVTHYYEEAHPYWNMDVAVIGAKNSAAIAALELFWTGARVTLIHRGPGISNSVKYWIKPNIENRIKAGEVKAYFNSHVKEIRVGEIVIATPEGDVTITNDFVLAMTGYRPELEFLALDGHHHSARDAEAGHRSANARKRAPRHLSGGRDRRGNAHQRDLHRERPLPRKTDRRRDRRRTGMNAWLTLLFAGLLETGWAVGLKYSAGFTKLWPSVFTAAAMIGSLYLLAQAVRVLPLGTAYAVWTGIGAVGAVLWGILYFGEPATAARILCVTLILAGIVGLRFAGGH